MIGLNTLNAQTQNYGIPEKKYTKTAETGTFTDALNSIVESRKNTLGINGEDIPENWTSGIGGHDLEARKNVENYLKSIGEDLSNRTPTHFVTEKQREWLASRHDLGSISEGGFSREYGELLGDLYYLNVISKDDITALNSPYPPTDSKHMYTMTKVSDDDMMDDDQEIEDMLEYIMSRIIKERAIVEQLTEQYSGIDSTQADKDFVDMINNYMKNKEELHQILSGLIG